MLRILYCWKYVTESNKPGCYNAASSTEKTLSKYGDWSVGKLSSTGFKLFPHNSEALNEGHHFRPYHSFPSIVTCVTVSTSERPEWNKESLKSVYHSSKSAVDNQTQTPCITATIQEVIHLLNTIIRKWHKVLWSVYQEFTAVNEFTGMCRISCDLRWANIYTDEAAGMLLFLQWKITNCISCLQ